MHGLFVLQILSSVAHFDYCWQEFMLSICCWSHTHYQTGRFLLFSVVNHLCDCRPYLHVLNLFLLALVQYFWTILVFSLAVTLCLFPDIGVSKESIFRWEIDVPVVSKLQKCLSRDTSNFLNIATPMFSVCVTGRMTRRYLYLQDKRKEFLIIPATYNAFICKLFEIWI